MTAYYNEHDPKAAAWLRELIRQGHVAPGVVDERSIESVTPNELTQYTQCHFFAGIGGWSLALRLAGWPDDRPVWTGSCPCQPFSAAGQGGGFDDERHLWPAWHYLIGECRPRVVFGEQVASKDSLQWLDLVHTDMEATGYAFGAFDLCAASVGAPHIRQRQWFVGHAVSRRSGRDFGTVFGTQGSAGWEMRSVAHSVEPASTVGILADSSSTRLEGRDERALGLEREAVERGSGAGALADDDDDGLGTNAESELYDHEHYVEPRGSVSFWSNADWIACRDGKSRPVEPGTFPLAHGVPARVGRLRGYGNAIVPQVAATVISAYLDRERR